MFDFFAFLSYYIFRRLFERKKKMKKQFTAILLTVMLLFSMATFIFAAGGVELPMIPIGGTTSLTVKLSSDTNGTVLSGEDVVFTTGISEIGTEGLSKVELSYTYTNGLEFRNDVKVIGIPSGWEISEITNENNVISFSVSDATGENPVSGRDLDITFSFRVASVSGSQLSVNFSDLSLYNKYGETVTRLTKRVTNNTFTTEASIPNIRNIGASLRINNDPALRLGMIVSKDARFIRAFPDGFKADNADVKFGMLVIEETKLRGELTVKTSGVTQEIFKESFSESTNEIIFVHTVNNVTNYKKNYVFRPFVMYRETPDGEYMYHYGEAKTRSAKTVAEMELLSETSAKKIEMLNKFVK